MARALPAVVLVALLAAGCGTSKDEGISGGGKVIGRTVTVYSIMQDPSGAARDLVDGEKLALSEANGRAGALAVNFSSLDAGDGSESDVAEAARRAINDPQIIAAIVDATDVTVPLFNAAGILQVAPGGDETLESDPNELPSGKPTVGAVKGQLPADFDTRFKAAFGRAPTSTAEGGYRAMNGVLHAIAEAGAAGNDRTRVIRAYGL